MKGLFLSAFAVFAAIAASAQHSADTIRVRDFGVVPDTYENCVIGIQRAIDSCRATPGAVLLFEPGRYDVWPEGAVRKEIFVSNTSSEVECPSKIKTIGLHFNSINSLTVDGAGAVLMMHGEITPVAVDGCSDVAIKNITVDFERPGGSEMTYTAVEPGKVTLKTHHDTRYDIRNGRISLIGEGWRSNKVHCIKYTPADGHFTYSRDWGVLSSATVRELEPGLLEFEVPQDFAPQPGSTLTLRDIIRRQVGMLLIESRNVSLSDVNMRYMHGLGIVSQYSHDITMTRVNCAPNPQSGRRLASSADFMHFSGCSGHIEITDCHYNGSHDDAINVHGTNLRIVDKLSARQARLRFMHHQTYGFAAYHPGDTVAFVNPHTMLRTDTAIVEAVVMENPRNLLVTFDRAIPAAAEIGATCVENLTCTPSLHVSGCTFTGHSTRGILATTPRKVVIENSVFDRLGMAAVLIEGDAEGWFESGPVTDVTIRNNTFIDCGYAGATHGATIAINPSNTEIDAACPVHTGIVITGNTFITPRPILYAKSTSNIEFKGNIVEDNPAPQFIFNGCANVSLRGNTMPAPRIDKQNCSAISIK